MKSSVSTTSPQNLASFSAHELHENLLGRFDSKQVVEELTKRASSLVSAITAAENYGTTSATEALEKLTQWRRSEEDPKSNKWPREMRVICGPQVFEQFFMHFISKSQEFAVLGDTRGIVNLSKLYRICDRGGFKLWAEKAMKPLCDIALGKFVCPKSTSTQAIEAVMITAGKELICLLPVRANAQKADAVFVRIGTYSANDRDCGLYAICKEIVLELDLESKRLSGLKALPQKLLPGLRSERQIATVCREIIENSSLPVVSRLVGALANTINEHHCSKQSLASTTRAKLLLLACYRKPGVEDLQSTAVLGLTEMATRNPDAAICLSELLISSIILPPIRAKIIQHVNLHSTFLPGSVIDRYRTALHNVAVSERFAEDLREAAQRKLDLRVSCIATELPGETHVI